jgi:hypothetical protein
MNGLNAKHTKDSKILGLSINYINGKAGKFLGGIYIQSDDISHDAEGSFKDRFRFGVNTRFSLASIFPMK